MCIMIIIRITIIIVIVIVTVTAICWPNTHHTGLCITTAVMKHATCVVQHVLYNIIINITTVCATMCCELLHLGPLLPRPPPRPSLPYPDGSTILRYIVVYRLVSYCSILVIWLILCCTWHMLYIYIYIYTHIYVYVYIHIYTHAYIYIYT